MSHRVPREPDLPEALPDWVEEPGGGVGYWGMSRNEGVVLPVEEAPSTTHH